MKHCGQQKERLRLLVLTIACTVFLAPRVGAADAQAANTNTVAGSTAKAAQSGTRAPAPKTKLVIREISGAELYSMHCNRCHPERYPTERTAAQWKTIMLHMRVRANLPGQQAKAILKYLQDNSGR